jgi:hypothetical protein
LEEKVAAPVQKTGNTAVEIRHAHQVAPSIRKILAITSPTSDCRSVGIVRSWTKTMEFLDMYRYEAITVVRFKSGVSSVCVRNRRHLEGVLDSR